jgi:hypothetical protein
LLYYSTFVRPLATIKHIMSSIIAAFQSSDPAMKAVIGVGSFIICNAVLKVSSQCFGRIGFFVI